jgi:DNA uptake protein ComE-like DNA-binding protein
MNFFRKKRLQQRLRQDSYYRFQSMEEVSWAIEIGITIDVNRATVDDWLRLPGLSIHQARAIANLTSQGVQILSIEDLGAILNIAAPRLQPLAPLLNFSYYAPELKPLQLKINQASAAELQQVPAITATLAAQIIAGRQQGNYRDFADLQQRLQLPGQIIMDLLPWFSFS